MRTSLLIFLTKAALMIVLISTVIYIHLNEGLPKTSVAERKLVMLVGGGSSYTSSDIKVAKTALKKWVASTDDVEEILKNANIPFEKKCGFIKVK